LAFQKPRRGPAFFGQISTSCPVSLLTHPERHDGTPALYGSSASLILPRTEYRVVHMLQFGWPTRQCLPLTQTEKINAGLHRLLPGINIEENVCEENGAPLPAVVNLLTRANPHCSSIEPTQVYRIFLLRFLRRHYDQRGEFLPNCPLRKAKHRGL